MSEYTIVSLSSGVYKAICKCGYIAIAMSAKTAERMIQLHIKKYHKK